jgi:ABC-2 type transport system ATP-binding protein
MSCLIELEEITKDYGSFRALDRVSLTIEPGITGLLGPNGAGKSTLIKVLLGLLRATSGRGRLLEFQLGRHNRQIRERVGYMPEDDCYLAGLSGVESVQLAAQLSRFPGLEALRRAHEILDFCGAGQERYRAVETYSTGMRQKLRFAQALVHDPPLLILDEPTSGLDPAEREAMLSRIKILARTHGKAVLLCTHILPDVQAVSDAVVILAKARVRVSDRLDRLSQPTAPSLRIQILGDAHEFATQLERHGLTVKVDPLGALTVDGAHEELAAKIWPIARQANVGVRSIEPSRNSLEEIFLAAVKEQPNAHS